MEQIFSSYQKRMCAFYMHNLDFNCQNNWKYHMQLRVEKLGPTNSKLSKTVRRKLENFGGFGRQLQEVAHNFWKFLTKTCSSSQLFPKWPDFFGPMEVPHKPRAKSFEALCILTWIIFSVQSDSYIHPFPHDIVLFRFQISAVHVLYSMLKLVEAREEKKASFKGQWKLKKTFWIFDKCLNSFSQDCTVVTIIRHEWGFAVVL